MAKQCELIVGYLLPRRCEETGMTTCHKCQRTACELHSRVGDEGLLCRDCYEQGQPRTVEALMPLPPPVQQTIYRRQDFLTPMDSGYEDDDDFALFDSDEGDVAFTALS